jgi:hypothetical protein
MTHLLQVLDLVVNGPIKIHIRQLRALTIVRAFRTFKDLHDSELSKLEGERDCIEFVAPKPALMNPIYEIVKLFAGEFQNENFKNSIRKTFESTGSIPNRNDCIFKIYDECTFECKYALPIVPFNTQNRIYPKEEKVDDMTCGGKQKGNEINEKDYNTEEDVVESVCAYLDNIDDDEDDDEDEMDSLQKEIDESCN